MSSNSDEVTLYHRNGTTEDTLSESSSSYIVWSPTIIMHIFLPVALASLLWGRKWFISQALLHLDARCISVLCPSISKRERLLRWAATQLPQMEIGLKSLWMDGSLLCTLINSVIPGACTNPHRHWKKPPTHAQALAYKYLGIIPEFSDDDFKSDDISSKLEQQFQNYLTILQLSVKKLSLEQDEHKLSFSSEYIARGMGLTTGEQHRKTFFYVYPSMANRYFDDLLINIKGPYQTYGSVVLSSLNLLSKQHTASINQTNQLGKEIHLESLNLVKPDEKSFLRSFSLDLSSIIYSNTINKGKSDIVSFNVIVEKGRAKVAFIPKNSGIYELCMTTNGEHIAGSPFNISIDKNSSGIRDSFDDLVRKLSYKTITRKVLKKEIDFITEKVILSDDDSNTTLEETLNVNESIMVELDDNIKILESNNNITETNQIKLDPECNDILQYSSEETTIEDNMEVDIEEKIVNVNGMNESVVLPVQLENHTKELHIQHIIEDELTNNNTNKEVNNNIEFQINNNKNESSYCSSELSISSIELEESESYDLTLQNKDNSINNDIMIDKPFNIVLNYKENSNSTKNTITNSLYSSSDLSTNSIDLVENEDTDLSSDEFIYFTENNSQTTQTERSDSSQSVRSVKDMIAQYDNNIPKKQEVNREISKVKECEPDLLTCHTARYSVIKKYASPIWKHIGTEDSATKDNESFSNISQEIIQENQVLNYSSDNIKSIESVKSMTFEEIEDYERNKVNNLPCIVQESNLAYPQSYYNKTSLEYLEMYQQRRKFWDRISAEESSITSSCSNLSTISQAISSSCEITDNQKTVSKRKGMLQRSNNMSKSLECFERTPNNSIGNYSRFDEDSCQSTNDLAYLSVNERKKLFIKEIEKHILEMNRSNSGKMETKYSSNVSFIKEQFDRNTIDSNKIHMDDGLVHKKIKFFDRSRSIKATNTSKVLPINPNTIKITQHQSIERIIPASNLITNKDRFLKAQQYFKELENKCQGKGRTMKNHQLREFSGNVIERRHSMECGVGVRKRVAIIRGGSLRLQYVCEKFPIDNIYKDVLGERRSLRDLKGSANKEAVIVTLSAMAKEKGELIMKMESELKEEIFLGQKEFKENRPMASAFPISY